MCFFKKKDSGIERPSPQDWIDDIDKEKLCEALGLDSSEVWIAGVADTNSMDGAIDIGHSLICTNNPEYLSRVGVGDVAVYGFMYNLIVHQIIEENEDAEGKYFRFKGWNNAKPDPVKVRPEDINWLVLGILW